MPKCGTKVMHTYPILTGKFPTTINLDCELSSDQSIARVIPNYLTCVT